MSESDKSAVYADDNHDGDGGDEQFDPHRSRHTTKFSRIQTDGGRNKLFGKRPHLSKPGRELANNVADRIAREQPDWCDDPSDPSMADVLKWLDVHGDPRQEVQTRTEATDTMAELLTKGLTFQEATVFYLFEHAGLTLREIYHVDCGKTKSYSRERDRHAERNVGRTLKSAAEKLGVDVDIVVE